MIGYVQTCITCWFVSYSCCQRTSLVIQQVKNLSANAGDKRHVSSFPWSGRSSQEGNGNLLQYSCLGNSLDRGHWWVTVHVIAKSQT